MENIMPISLLRPACFVICIGLFVGILGGCSLFGDDLPNAEPGGLLETSQHCYDAEVAR